MNLRRSTLQTHLKPKKPYQSAADGRRHASHLIRINEVFLSLFCFRRGFYSRSLCNRGSIDHEHSNNRTGL
jgi:hypothetical protein